MFNSNRIQLKKQNLMLSYRTYGNPGHTPLLILHGFPESSQQWEDFAQEFAKLGHYVICPDQRGFGNTHDNSSLSCYTINSLASDMIEFLDLLNISKIHLLGHDWGGAIGWFLSTNYSSYFESFTCLNAPHWRVMKKEITTNLKQMVRSWYIFFIQLPYLPERYFQMTNFKLIKELLKKSGHPLGERFEPQLELAWEKNIHSMLSWYRAILKFNDKNPPQRLQLKTRLLWGAQDPFFNQSLAQSTLDFCENAKLSIIGSSGHWPHHECKEVVFKALIDNINT